MAHSASGDPDLSKEKSPSGLVSRWLKEMELVEQSKEQQEFEKHGERILKKYKNDTQVANYNPQTPSRVTFNVLWSNCQVLEPALYSRMPKVVAERIFKDHDPIGRFAAEIAERATHFNLITQQDQFNYAVTLCVQDRLLPGRGTGWLVFKVEMEEAKDEAGNPLYDKDGKCIQVVKQNSERVEFVHLNYCDYLESKARTQTEVRWRTRVMYYTRAEATEEFGVDAAEKLDYTSNPYQTKKNKGQDEDPEFLQQAKVYQIYDLSSKDVLFISPGNKGAPLKKSNNPMKLKGFWCSPIPLLATCTSDSTYPTPDYRIYEALADELDFVCNRLNAMTDCIRLVGLVASQHNKTVKEMLRLSDGSLQPMEGWQAFIQKGGLSAMVSWLPFENAVAAMPVLQARFADLKAQIDEITSMPDIIRGSSDPNDPVYTQQQKSHWTVIKLVKKQQDVQRFCREIISKMAEIIFEPGFFSDETIWLMAGVGQMPPDKQAMFVPALQLLRDDRLRTFRIDIETDSTIAMNEAEAMESWAKYLEGLNVIFSNVQAVMQFRPELLKPMLESAIGAARTMRTGRNVEGSLELALEEIEAQDKAAKENPQPPPPDPALIAAQTDQQRAQTEAQKIQMDAQKSQAELGLKGQESQFNQWEKTQRLSLDASKNQGDFVLGQEKNQIAGGKEMSRAKIDEIITQLDAFKAQLMAATEADRIGMEKQRLQFEAQEAAALLQEKLIEERRLAGTNQVEAAHIALKHKELETKERIEDKKLQVAKKKASQPQKKTPS